LKTFCIFCEELIKAHRKNIIIAIANASRTAANIGGIIRLPPNKLHPNLGVGNFKCRKLTWRYSNIGRKTPKKFIPGRNNTEDIGNFVTIFPNKRQITHNPINKEIIRGYFSTSIFPINVNVLLDLRKEKYEPGSSKKPIPSSPPESNNKPISGFEFCQSIDKSPIVKSIPAPANSNNAMDASKIAQIRALLEMELICPFFSRLIFPR
jgi:hypothetical protein